MGNHLTLADIIIFRFLRLLMITVYSETQRKSFLNNLTLWFINIMKSKEAIEVYGRTILCLVVLALDALVVIALHDGVQDVLATLHTGIGIAQ